MGGLPAREEYPGILLERCSQDIGHEVIGGLKNIVADIEIWI